MLKTRELIVFETNPRKQVNKRRKNPLAENQKYVVNNEFLSSKKVTLIDRYRQNIKKLNAKRKQQNLISYVNQYDCDFNSSFTLKRVETEGEVMERTLERTMENMKKRVTFGGAKRFYNRPATKSQNRAHSMIDSNLKAKAIGLKSKEK